MEKTHTLRHKTSTSASLVHSITVPDDCQVEKPFQFRVQRSTPQDLREGAQCKYYTRDQIWSGRGLFLRGLKITKEGSVVVMCACTFSIFKEKNKIITSLGMKDREFAILTMASSNRMLDV